MAQCQRRTVMGELSHTSHENCVFAVCGVEVWECKPNNGGGDDDDFGSSS
jgi:hypothetical protein